jgi:hypothetical protein
VVLDEDIVHAYPVLDGGPLVYKTQAFHQEVLGVYLDGDVLVDGYCLRLEFILPVSPGEYLHQCLGDLECEQILYLLGLDMALPDE